MPTPHADTASPSALPTVLDASQGLPPSLKIRKLPIHYPRRWFAPIALSRFAQSIEDETLHWMASLELLPSEQVLHQVRAMEPRHYAGYSHSMAAYDHALMYCKYITMWLLWDDERVEPAPAYGADIAHALAALAGQAYPAAAAGDPYVRAFAHIGDQYQRLGASTAWRQRFADKMREWAAHAIAEQQVRRRGIATGRSLEEALRLRAITVGIRPNSLPLERAVGIELPAALLASPNYTALIDQAALICCIVNDLVGIPKDLQHQQQLSNLALFQMLSQPLSLGEAVARIMEIHDAAVDRYDQLAAALLQECAPAYRERVATFCDHLRYMDTGFGYWHRDCVRYQRWVAVAEGQALKFSIGLRPQSRQPAAITATASP